VVGEGDLDLVFVPGWVSHVEQCWEAPHYAAFLERLASFSRLILLDRAGTGLSDPVPHLPTLVERGDEVRAVMGAARVERAALVGVSSGGSRRAGAPGCRWPCSRRAWRATPPSSRRGAGSSAVPSARYLAAHIPGARLVVLPGDDHLPYVRDAGSILARFYALVRSDVARFRGRELDTAGDAFLSAFDGSAARVAAAAAAGEILVSSTVKDLVVGSELLFEERASRVLNGVPGEWRLYAAAE
jgi:pimeloyl-ACP methyl ester carboxylesterase